MENKIATDILVKLDELTKEYRLKFGYNGKEIEINKKLL